MCGPVLWASSSGVLVTATPCTANLWQSRAHDDSNPRNSTQLRHSSMGARGTGATLSHQTPAYPRRLQPRRRFRHHHAHYRAKIKRGLRPAGGHRQSRRCQRRHRRAHRRAIRARRLHLALRRHQHPRAQPGDAGQTRLRFDQGFHAGVANGVDAAGAGGASLRQGCHVEGADRVGQGAARRIELLVIRLGQLQPSGDRVAEVHDGHQPGARAVQR